MRVQTNAELVNALEVRQVELETQNDELVAVRLELDAAQDRFDDALYDAAPVGYLTLDTGGQVTQANLTGAALLGTARNALAGRGFARFVVPAQVDRWLSYLQRVCRADGPRRIELVLRKPSEELFHAQLDCVLETPEHGATSLRLTLTDITPRKLAEMDRQIAERAQDTREAERRNVAREMHEGLGQRLSVLKMDLASLPLDNKAVVVRERVGSMLESLDDAVASVRRIVIDLRPPMLDDLGLPAAIDWLAHDVGRRMGLSVRLDLPELVGPVDGRTSTAMYRMAQVILEHASHAAATEGLAVSMVQHPTELVLSVRCTVPPRADSAQAAAGGAPQPVQDLHDRARSLGARLEIITDRSGDLSFNAHLLLPGQQAPFRVPNAQEQPSTRREGRSDESKRESG